MRYNVGDKVRIRRDIEAGKYGVVDSMLKYRGRVMTIWSLMDNREFTGGYGYTMEGDSLRYVWAEETLEPVEEAAMAFGIVETNDSIHHFTPKELAFQAITATMLDTYIRKNHDYGDSFGEGFKEFGLTSAVIRLGDKYRRLKSLCKDSAKVNDESINDTLLDMANYAVMTLVEMEGVKNEERR